MKLSTCFSFVILITAIIFSNAAISQTEIGSGKFDKKSISIIPVTTPEYAQYHEQMLNGLIYLGKTGQYDYNNVSRPAIRKFENLFVNSNFDLSKADSQENIEQLTKMLREAGIIDEIINTAINFDTVFQRYKNSLKKADGSGYEPIPDDPDKGATFIVSNTYIGIPIYTNFDKEAKGKLLWLKFERPNTSDWNKVDLNNLNNNTEKPKLLSINSDKIKLQKVAVKDVSLAPMSDNLGFDARERLNNEEEKKLAPAEAGARIITRSVIKFAETLEDFKQRGVLQNKPNGGLGIDIGLREGVYFDEGFKVYAKQQGTNGKDINKYVGFIRLKDIADTYKDPGALSDFYTIIPGSFQEGYTAASHPKFADVYLKVGYKNVFIPREILGIAFTNDIFEKDIKNVLSLEASAAFNIGRYVKITQLYLGATGSYGIPFATTVGDNSWTPSIISGELFLQKKFWFQRFNLSIAATGGFDQFSIKSDIGSQEYKISTDGLCYSVGGRASLEFAINPDMNLAFDAGYKYVFEPTKIKYEIGDTEFIIDKDLDSYFWNNYKLGDLRLGGLNFGLRFTYSIPAL